MKLYTHTSTDGCLRGVAENGRFYTGRSRAEFDRIFPPSRVTERIEIGNLNEFRRLRQQVTSGERRSPHSAEGNQRTIDQPHILYQSRDGRGMRHAVSNKGPVLVGAKEISRSSFHGNVETVELPGSEFCVLRDKLVREHNQRRLENESLQALAAERRRQEQPVHWAYEESDAAFTRRILRQLEAKGIMGCIAAQLFRAQKSSSRAKEYRGEYIGHAYARKGECLKRLCDLLVKQGDLSWGWGTDNQMNEFGPCCILYIDLPQGQVSFHNYERFAGPDYPHEWDNRQASAERILVFCEAVLSDAPSRDAYGSVSPPMTVNNSN